MAFGSEVGVAACTTDVDRPDACSPAAGVGAPIGEANPFLRIAAQAAREPRVIREPSPAWTERIRKLRRFDTISPRRLLASTQN